MRVGIFVPPFHPGNFPHLGPAALTAFLKHRGVLAEQHDLNLQLEEYLRDKGLE